jgi:hypothetical protein
MKFFNQKNRDISVHKNLSVSVLAAAASLAAISPLLAQPAPAPPPETSQQLAPPPPAQPPTLPPRPRDAGQETGRNGTVSQYLMNPDGVVDGLLLTDNTIVRFPPHLSQQLVRTLKPQDVVRVEGFFESQGVLHATTITDSNSRQSVSDTPPSPQNPPPAPNPTGRQAMNVNGTIRVLTHAKRGEIDGAVLDNGTLVHVLPPVAMQYANLFRVGAPLAASGYGTANGYGRSLEATAIGPSPDELQTVSTAEYGRRDRPRKRGRGRPPE